MTVSQGWYEDPGDRNQLRWWDGRQWTAHVQPKSPPSPLPTSQVADPEPSPPVSVAPAVLPASGSVHGSPPASPPGVEVGFVPVDGSAGAPTGVAAGVLDERRRLLGGRRAAEEENDRLREALASIGVAERDGLQREIERLQQERVQLGRELELARAELRDAQREVVETRDQALLQEVGIYQYSHPLDDAAAYKSQLAALSDRIKVMARSGDAIVGSTSWTVNGSVVEGRKMIREFSKLMLRAYNNEADAAVRSMRPFALASAKARLDKAATTISKLGRTMSIYIAVPYHELRFRELELTADYLVKAAEEKEREREERARMREEARARAEYEREQARLSKELAHYENALEALRAQGDMASAEETAARVAEIRDALEGINRRAANARAGYVYVISNLGAFGPNMVKIGMTRRLEPMDRVRELGDASVPFRYDVHALFFSDDAVGVETKLHQSLAARRVNLVNSHREFFYATPLEVKGLLAEIQGNLLHYTDDPEALEWHQSQNTRPTVAAGTA